jgi:membrane protein
MTRSEEYGRNMGNTGALRRRLAASGTFALYAARRFSRDGCFAAAGALSYTTLVSLVPLCVIALGTLSAFPIFAPMRARLLALVFQNFVPEIGEQAAYWFQYFASSAGQTTAIGIIGIAATGILLLATVEDQLNLIWRATRARPWVQRVLTYWTLMTLGPLMLGLSLSLSTYFEIAARHVGFGTEIMAVAGGWLASLARLLPALFELVTCTLLYCLIPNCAVRWRDGLLGAVIATAAIEILKIGFSIYIGVSSFYRTVYGALAAIPIFLLWMYISWLAVMLGAVVAANLPNWRVDERLVRLSAGGVRLGFSLALLAALARAQRRGLACGTPEIAGELGVATSVIDEHLQRLTRGGFAAHTQSGAWVLAWNLESATLHDLYDALDLPLAGSWSGQTGAPWQQQVAPAMDRIITAETAAMQVTIATLIADVRLPESSRRRRRRTLSPEVAAP